ncbi:MAG: hypothetical protein FJ291_28065 [Planctomycetes bacterium]|nr:hypothetical protein [Planctomycetota bacterium]
MATKKGLDEVVMDALKLYATPPSALPDLRAQLGRPTRRLVTGSGNAFATGKILFADEDAVFADEGQYREKLGTAQTLGVDAAVVISASGEKDAPEIVAYLRDSFPKMPTHLLTCNGDSAAARLLREHQGADHVIVTPRNPEPITYNTSTYLGMILAKTHEEAGPILKHIEAEVVARIPRDLTQYDAFYLIVEPKFDLVREMLVTKFDELFGPMLVGRCYTWAHTRHAKTLVHSEKELFINFGVEYENTLFGHEDARLHIPVPEWAGYAAMVAIGYYVIGRIQAQFPAWFKWNADRYKAWQDAQFR